MWAAGCIGGLVLVFVASQVALERGTVVSVVAPMIAMVVGAVVTMVLDYALLDRERQKLRRLFAKHVPGVVEQVLAGGAGDSLPTAIVPGYRLEAVLGKGGMGVVYRARQLLLNRRVAVKLLRPELADDDDFRERFEREAHLAAAIEHPNVVPIYEAGECDGLLYVVMRLVDGVTLGGRDQDAGVPRRRGGDPHPPPGSSGAGFRARPRRRASRRQATEHP